jgi:hypothetical protein
MKCTVLSSCVLENVTMTFSVAVVKLGFEVRVGDHFFY